METEGLLGEGEIGRCIGANLKRLRTDRKLSIDALAARIGVSRLTLLNIEKGEANPTLSVIWKIANGLGIPINSLLSMKPGVSISRKKSGISLASSDEVFLAEPMFHSDGFFELYRGYLRPESEYASEPHQPDVVEFVSAMSGALIVEVDGDTYSLGEYDSIRFNGDRPHKYVNPSLSVTVLHFVITYGNRFL